MHMHSTDLPPMLPRPLTRCPRIGEYQLAVASNVRAYNLDVSQATQCVVPYLPEHNVNMLIYAARYGLGQCLSVHESSRR